MNAHDHRESAADKPRADSEIKIFGADILVVRGEQPAGYEPHLMLFGVPAAISRHSHIAHSTRGRGQRVDGRLFFGRSETGLFSQNEELGQRSRIGQRAITRICGNIQKLLHPRHFE